MTRGLEIQREIDSRGHMMLIIIFLLAQKIKLKKLILPCRIFKVGEIIAYIEKAVAKTKITNGSIKI